MIFLDLLTPLEMEMYNNAFLPHCGRGQFPTFLSDARDSGTRSWLLVTGNTYHTESTCTASNRDSMGESCL